MHRKSGYGWVAALALAAVLGVMGARPAAAADLSEVGVVDQFAGLWSALSAGPAALWDSLIGWFDGSGIEKSDSSVATDDDPLNEGGTFGMDPNGGH